MICSIGLTGCASMFSGSEQQVTIKTSNNSEIFIDGRYVGKGYSKRNLSRDEFHVISVSQGNCKNSLTTQARFNKMSLLGFLVDLGLVSMPVDFLTGAAWNIYPNKIELQALCDSTSIN